MHQELDAHRLPRVRRHVHLLVDPGVAVKTLMEDRLQDGARAIRDISILPVERNAVGGEIPVPEAHGSSTSRYRKLLIERAVSARLRPRDFASQSRKRPTVHLGRADHGIVTVAVNYPRWKAACLESTVLD